MSQIDIIFHLASSTIRSDFSQNPVETIDANLFGTARLLKYAKANKVKKFLLASSMSIYGVRNTKEFIAEDDYGYIDLQNIETSYDEAKRMAEALCLAYGKNSDTNMHIARIGGTFGIGMRKDTEMATNTMLRQAMNFGIVKVVNPDVWRANTYVSDTVLGLFYILFFAENLQAYNVSNMKEYMSMHSLGSIIAKAVGVKLVIEQNSTAARLNKMVLDSSKLSAIGYSPKITTQKGITHMYEYIKDSPNLSQITGEDIGMIIADEGLQKAWHKLDGKTVLVTGASGMIPHYVVHTLMHLETIGIKINVIALSRSEEKLKAKFADYLSKPNFHIIAQDVAEPISSLSLSRKTQTIVE
ncbi:hypothetical protein AGMMS50229_06000 [Campylobacterota bacterium]|nr:hypothetical protein AGMMS50229_06000 [Campylobacterota bacterium]